MSFRQHRNPSHAKLKTEHLWLEAQRRTNYFYFILQTLQDHFDISKPSAFCFGTEKEGLSEEIMQKADGFLKIPMVGFTESLNISVSAAIILQNLTKQ